MHYNTSLVDFFLSCLLYICYVRRWGWTNEKSNICIGVFALWMMLYIYCGLVSIAQVNSLKVVNRKIIKIIYLIENAGKWKINLIYFHQVVKWHFKFNYLLNIYSSDYGFTQTFFNNEYFNICPKKKIYLRKSLLANLFVHFF